MILLRVYQLLRIFLYPVIWSYSQLNTQGRIRYQLERELNRRDSSFIADILFEVSSEGELEQVLYLIKDCISDGKKIELIFSSDSVINKCRQLQSEYPQNLRIFAIPFLSYFPFFCKRSLNEIVTAPRIIMCRYDFFPEMLEVCLKRELCIVAANGMTLKKNKGIKKYWYHQFYKKVKQIVASTQYDAREIERIYSHTECSSFDFRSLQIYQRNQDKEKKYQKLLFPIEQIRKKIVQAEYSLVMGSLWLEDIPSISDCIWSAAKEGKLYIAILPHSLSPKNIQLISQAIPQTCNVKLITQRGVLCELYGEFSHAFVGGGYKGSPGVHSLLEPQVSGCHLYCGVEVKRSSEYRAIIESGQSILVVDKKNPLKLETLKSQELYDSKTLRDQAKLERDYLKIKKQVTE